MKILENQNKIVFENYENTSFEENDKQNIIRTVKIDNLIWYVANDVMKIIYNKTNNRNILHRHNLDLKNII
jgi:prophage antirepressor-like protein